MLFQSWLLIMLVPLALGAPVSQEPRPPTLTIMDIANATSPEKLANSGKKIALGSKSRLHGSASSDEYPALGNGGGHKNKTGTAGDTWENAGKMGLNRANKMHTYYKSVLFDGAANVTLSNGSEGLGTGVSGPLGGTLGESSGGNSPETPSHGSGSSTASKNKAIGSQGIPIDTTINGNDNGLSSVNDTGSGATTTGQQGTTLGTDTTSASGSNVSGTNIPSSSNGVTSSTSKHR